MAKKIKKEFIPDYYEKDPNIELSVKDLIQKEFADLLNANIGVLVKVSEKQTISKEPAKLHLVNKLNRFFSGLDFILEIERTIINQLTPTQLEHLLYRTLSHGDINDKGEYKIKSADYKFFRPELKKYGGEGLYDIMEVVHTIKSQQKNKNADFEFEDLDKEFDENAE